MCAMCPWPRGAWHWGADAGGSAGLATGLEGCANKCVCVVEPCKRVKVGGGVKASKMHLPPAQQRRGDGAQPPGEGRRPRGRTPPRGSVWDPRGRARGAEVSPRPPPPACGAFSPAPWSSGEIQTHP